MVSDTNRRMRKHFRFIGRALNLLPRWISKIGFAWAIVYSCWAAFWMIESLRSGLKDSVTFAELAFAPAAFFLSWTGLFDLIQAYPGRETWLDFINNWIVAYAISVALIFGLGWIFERYQRFAREYDRGVGKPEGTSTTP